MKKLTSGILSCILALVMCLTSLPVYAAEQGKFISFDINTTDIEGNPIIVKDVAYAVGKELYVTPKFLTDYLPYSYYKDTHTFVRLDHPSNSIFGNVTVDYENKTATLGFNLYNKKVYDLEEIYELGNNVFLPLSKMAALMKSYITVEDKKMTIVCSGISLDDAQYALSLVESDIIPINTNDVIDEIFYGDEKLFKFYAVSTLYLSEILKLKFVDFIPVIGQKMQNEKIYSDFIEKCLTDYTAYYTKSFEEQNALNNLNTALGCSEDIQGDVKNIQKFVSPLKKLMTFISDDDKNKNLPEYIKKVKLSENFGEALSFVKEGSNTLEYIFTSLDVMNFMFNLQCMTDDHKLMMNNAKKFIGKSKNFPGLALALDKSNNKYAKSFGTGMVANTVSILIDETVSAVEGAVLDKVIPLSVALNVLGEVSKAAGYNFIDTYSYNIILEIEFKQLLCDKYYRTKDFSKTTKNSENYRVNTIFLLQACKHLLLDANTLGATVPKGTESNYFKKLIEEIDDILFLYYGAAGSMNFDSEEAVDANIKTNEKAISESGLIADENVISESEAEIILNDLPEADNEDIKMIPEALSQLMPGGLNRLTDYNCTEITYEEFIKNWLLCGTYNDGYSFVYSYFYPEKKTLYSASKKESPSYTDEDLVAEYEKPDPLNKFMSGSDNYEAGIYYKYDIDLYESIMTEIFNIPESVIKSADKDNIEIKDYYDNLFAYCYDNALYSRLAMGLGDGGGMPVITVENYEKMPDGRYKVFLKQTADEYFGHPEDNYTATAVMSLKNFNGKKQWSIYSIKINSSDKDDVSNNTEFLKAEEDDISLAKNFLDAVFMSSGGKAGTYIEDIEKTTYENFIKDIFLFTNGTSPVYDWFSESEYNNEISCYSFDKEKVDWIMKEVFDYPDETIKDESIKDFVIRDDYSGKTNFYYKDGKFYSLSRGCGTGYDNGSIRIDSYKQLPDGRYEMTVYQDEYRLDDKKMYEGISKATVVMGYKKKDNMKYWAIYSCNVE